MNLNPTLTLPSDWFFLSDKKSDYIISTINTFNTKKAESHYENKLSLSPEEDFEGVSLTMQEENLIHDLRELYMFEENEGRIEIESFIKKYKLAKVLLEAYGVIREFFKQNIVKIELELDDFEKELEELFIKVEISVEKSEDEIRKLLNIEEKLIKEWLLEKEKSIRDRLNLVVELI